VVSLIWFMYNFSTYSFNLYSSAWIKIIVGDNVPLWQTFAWSTLVNVFYLPGSFAGAYISDWIGPKHCLTYGVLAQGVVGFIMSGAYAQLATSQHVAAFVVVYG
jgi:MFS family permease